MKGEGAFLNGDPLRVTDTAELIDAVIASGFPYDKHTNPDNNLKEWAAFLRRIRGERRLGSAALDLCYVAAGRLDGYWEKDLKPYDAMAGMLILREAGGIVTDYAGGPNPPREDRGRYVGSHGRLHAAMLQGWALAGVGRHGSALARHSGLWANRSGRSQVDPAHVAAMLQVLQGD